MSLNELQQHLLLSEKVAVVGLFSFLISVLFHQSLEEDNEVNLLQGLPLSIVLRHFSALILNATLESRSTAFQSELQCIESE